jgi:hypothetical protein
MRKPAYHRLPPGKNGMKELVDPEDRAEVAFLVDAVRREYGFIGQAFFPDTDPAQLVTDYFYLFYSILHRVYVYLAGDTIKRCIAGFSACCPECEGISQE